MPADIGIGLVLQAPFTVVLDVFPRPEAQAGSALYARVLASVVRAARDPEVGWGGPMEDPLFTQGVEGRPSLSG